MHALTNIRLWTYPQCVQHIPVIIPPTTQLRIHLHDPGLHRIRNCARARCSVCARDTPNLPGTPGKIGQHALWSTWIVGWESWYYTDYLITYDVNESHAIKMPQKELPLMRTVDPKLAALGLLCPLVGIFVPKALMGWPMPKSLLVWLWPRVVGPQVDD